MTGAAERPAVSAPHRFALPPSVGVDLAATRAHLLQEHLDRTSGLHFSVEVCHDYAELNRDLISGRIEAAWAPPFACARLENLGARILLREVRRGTSSYRAALVGRVGGPTSLAELEGKVAVWADKNSVAGYLLPVAYLRAHGIDPAIHFAHQHFAGSYRAALEQVVDGRADVTSIFAPPAASSAAVLAGLDELAPEWRRGLAAIAVTDECPTGGVAVSPAASAGLASALERALLVSSVESGRLLNDTFRVDRFERGEPNAYRALYKVALAAG
jgi:phosphonate transport system substrate-binding protein